MGLNIIIRGKANIGRTRSEQETNIRKEWGPTMSGEQLDKCKFIERKTKEITGGQARLVDQAMIDNLR